ncbi:MAG: type I-E CRISPR-associated protein Cse2/CasB [Thermoguttaceae bacterium]|nr:type I-E CRISPR-associated protein Cse2/CasB [Thermoguttaceae bacterium]
MTETSSQKYKAKRFVERVIARLRPDSQGKTDNGFRAAMTRADHEATAPQAWRFLLELGNVDLEKDWERQAFALVGAAMARERTETNGTQSLGRALFCCKVDPKEADDSIERRLRRILACENSSELVAVLRQTIRFMQRSDKVRLDYEWLLRDILFFNEKTKVRWAQDYYGRHEDEDAKEAE